jgi:hypothetical protein
VEIRVLCTANGLELTQRRFPTSSFRSSLCLVPAGSSTSTSTGSVKVLIYTAPGMKQEVRPALVLYTAVHRLPIRGTGNGTNSYSSTPVLRVLRTHTLR